MRSIADWAGSCQDVVIVVRGFARQHSLLKTIPATWVHALSSNGLTRWMLTPGDAIVPFSAGSETESSDVMIFAKAASPILRSCAAKGLP
jgi:hypothetical protein